MELETLEVKIKGAPAAQRDLNAISGALLQIEKNTRRTTDGVDKLSGSLRKAALNLKGALAGMGLASLARSTIQAISTFQSLNASLHTITGSAEGAAQAMDLVKRLAVETPFSVEDLTRAFIRLKAQGLDASRESLLAYGDIASAFEGKTIIDFAEAVGDAVMGEQERLKEFGIKMEQEGDKVNLTFGGMTTTVEKNSKAIEDAIRGIAQANFGGAMQRQSETISGAFARLSDAWDQFLAKVGEGGLNDAIRDLVDWLTELLNGSDRAAYTIGSVLGDAVRAFTELAKVAVDVTKTLFSLLGYHPLLNIAGREIDRVNKGTMRLVKDLRAMDTSNAQGLADKMKAIRSEIEKARAGLIGAGEATSAWLTRLSILERLQAQTVAPAVESITSNVISAIQGIRDSKEKKSVADLRTELEKAKAERDRVEKELGQVLVEIDEAQKQKESLQGDLAAMGFTNLAASPAIGELDLVAMAERVSSLSKQATLAVQRVQEAEAALDLKQGKAGQKLEEKALKKLEDSFLDLELQAEAALQRKDIALSLDPKVREGLEVETKLLEWKNSLIRAGVELDDEAIKQARALIKTTYDANKALEAHNKIQEGLSDLRKEAAEGEDVQRLVGGGLDSKELAIQIEMLKRRNELKITDPTELAELEELVRRIFAARDATDALTRAREQAKDVRTGLDDELLRAQEELRLQGLGLSKRQLVVEQKLLEIRLANKDLTAAEVESYRGQVEAIVDAQAALEKLKNSHSALKGFIRANEDLWGNLEAFGVSAIDKLADTWAEFLAGGEVNLKDFVQSALKELNKLLFKFVASEALSGIFPGVAASVFHAGGTAGGAAPTRQVSPLAFVGAPRYHSGGIAGLRPDEVPAILQRGELVLPRDQVRSGAQRKRASGGTARPIVNNISFQVFSPNPDAFRASQREIEQDLAVVVDLAMRQRGGNL